jgi:hypothetical protein
MLEQLGPVIYVAVITAVLVCCALVFARKERNSEKH